MREERPDLRRARALRFLDQLDGGDPLTLEGIGEVFGPAFWTMVHDFLRDDALRDKIALAVLPGICERWSHVAPFDIGRECYLVAEAILSARAEYLGKTRKEWTR